MSKYGKISIIKKDFSNSGILSMDKSLSAAGLTRIPGTGVWKFPYKEFTNKYRTGLDPDAGYIARIQDEQERALEKKRVTDLRVKLEKALGVDLGPNSSFWNSKLKKDDNDHTHVSGYKLEEGDNFFNFQNPMQELNFAWLRVHPTVASSMQAYERGEYPAETQWYVSDESIENQVLFKKKDIINKAIVKLTSMSVEKRKKVARMLGLPVTDETGEEAVYNLIDDILKKSEFTSGKYSGLSPVTIFTGFADMKEQLLDTKDLVKQAITHSVLRTKNGGKIYRGEHEVSSTEDTYVEHLVSDDGQEDLILLKEELKSKKLASV